MFRCSKTLTVSFHFFSGGLSKYWFYLMVCRTLSTFPNISKFLNLKGENRSIVRSGILLSYKCRVNVRTFELDSIQKFDHSWSLPLFQSNAFNEVKASVLSPHSYSMNFLVKHSSFCSQRWEIANSMKNTTRHILSVLFVLKVFHNTRWGAEFFTMSLLFLLINVNSLDFRD